MIIFETKANIPMKKFVSILLAYCILILPTGCTTTKYLSLEEASSVKTDKNYLVLHTPQKLYKLYDYKFTENALEGTLKQYSGKKNNKLQVYTPINFELKSDINSNQFITLERVNIEKITYSTPEADKTVWIIGAGVLTIIVILILTGGVTYSPDITIGA